MGFMKKLGGMDPRLPRGKTGKGPSEPMAVRPRLAKRPKSSKPSGIRRGLGGANIGLSKGPGMKAGKKVNKVKMNIGMQVPTYNDVVRRKTGGKV
jgi:hypothetical protein